jgi:hypothetical protein
VAAALVLAVGAERAGARRGPKPAPCPGALYLVEAGVPLVPSGSGPVVRADAVAVRAAGDGTAPQVALLSGCPEAPLKRKATRKGTRLAARWRRGACPGVAGPVRLRARTASACEQLAGTVRAGRAAQAFTARRFDGRVAPVLEASAAASAVLSEAGGTVSATAVDGTRYTLTVPAGALVAPETITLTPVTAVDGLPLTGGLLAAVDLAPDGLFFLTPATLTIALPAAVAPAEVMGFGWEGAGENFHLDVAQTTGTTVTLSIAHFSGAGAGTTAPASLAAIILGPWGTGSQPYRNQLAALSAAGAPDPDLLAVLYAWFDNHVLAAIAAAGTDDTALVAALKSLMDWEDGVFLLGLSDPGITSRRQSGRNQLAAPLAAAIARANQRCQAQQSLAGAEDALRWQAIAEALGVVGVVAGLDLPTVLANLCVEILYEDTSYALTPQAGVTSPLTLDVRIAFKSGGTSLTQPIGIEVDATGTTPNSASGNTDAAGIFTAPFTPVGGQEVSFVADACVDDPAYPKVSQHVCQTAIIVRGIEVTPPTAQLAVGATQQFTALLAGVPYANVTWTTSGGSVDPSGVYTAAGPGTFTVTATDNTNSGSSASASVLVGALGCALPGGERQINANATVSDDRGLALNETAIGDMGTVTMEKQSDTDLHALYASSSASFGSIGAHAAAQAKIGNAFDPYYARALGLANWRDTVVLQPAGNAPASVTVRGRVQIQATGAVAGGLGALVNANAHVYFGTAHAEVFEILETRSGDFDVQETLELTLNGVEVDRPQLLYVTLLVNASNQNVVGDAQADITVRWLGITSVEDDAGTPVVYTLCSASGVDWTQAQ